MSPEDIEFIARRAKYTRRWNVVALLSLILLSAMAGNLWITVPHMINPLHVKAMIAEHSLTCNLAATMAAVLPYMVLFIFFLMVILIIYATVMIRNEKRFLKIIEKMKNS